VIALSNLGSPCRLLVLLAVLAWTGEAAVAAETKPAAPEAAPAGPAVPPPPAVAVDTLDAPRPDGMGLVGAAGGGFADTLWRGTPGETAQVLVAALPRRYAVPGARHLAIRFLLSAAPVERSSTGADVSANAMLEQRILALAGMAAWDDALALMDFMPARSRTPYIARTRINGLLAKGRVDAACGDARQLDPNDINTQKLQVLCQFSSGQASAAAVSLGLLREQGVDEKLFLWAVDVLQGSEAPAPAELVRAAASGTLDPVVLALLRQAGYLLPRAVIDTNDPNILMFAAQTALAPPPPKPEVAEPPPAKGKGKAKKPAEKPVKPGEADELRLLTVERAVAAGVAFPEDLRTAYGAYDAPDNAPPNETIAIETARQRAATYQLAVAQTMPGSQAEVIFRAIDLARLRSGSAEPTLTTMAQVYRPIVAGFPVSSDLAWFAGTAIRVLLAADSTTDMSSDGIGSPLVRQWFDLLHGQTMTSVSPDAAVGYAGVWPYLRLTRPGSAPVTAEEFAAWQRTLPSEPPMRSLMLRASALDLLTAVGDGIPPAHWQSAVAATSATEGLANGPVPSALLWNMLAQAERAGRVGEVTALSLRFFGADAGAPSSIAVSKSLEALTIVGRARDARMIAIEFAIERGL